MLKWSVIFLLISVILGVVGGIIKMISDKEQDTMDILGRYSLFVAFGFFIIAFIMQIVNGIMTDF